MTQNVVLRDAKLVIEDWTGYSVIPFLSNQATLLKSIRSRLSVSTD